MCNLQIWSRAESPWCELNHWGKPTRSDWMTATEQRKLCIYRRNYNKYATSKKRSGIKLWSKYRCRVTVSLWLRTHRMGDTLQCTTKADADIQSQHENEKCTTDQCYRKQRKTALQNYISFKSKCSGSTRRKAALSHSLWSNVNNSL